MPDGGQATEGRPRREWKLPAAALLLALGSLAASVATGVAPTGPERPSAPAPVATEDTGTGTVVLLHGLGRTARSMEPMERALERAGYGVVNLGYPSRELGVPELADSLALELERCCATAGGPVHFVTHSLGGIVLRQYLATHQLGRLGRVVMLSPPNRGTEVVDRLPDDLLVLVLGPAGARLGTDTTDVPAQLPPVRFELGVITGDASINPLFSWWIPGEDDGTVSVRSAWVEGTTDFLVVPYSHTLIMHRPEVMRQVLAFLGDGAFLD